MDFKFPLFFSKFIRKRDAKYQGDPDGDYVEADDINELQESIERLEYVIGIEDLKGTVSSQLQAGLGLEENDFGSPLFINYKGSSINTYETINERISAFSYIPYLAIKKETSSSSEHFIKEVIASGTNLYGIIDSPHTPINNVKSQIDWFKERNFKGVLLYDFGYVDGFTRNMQNEILEHVHSKEMNAIFTGEIETTLFNKPHKNNPDQLQINVTPDDIYLAENVFVVNGEKNSPSIITEKTFNLNKAQKDLGIKVFVEDHMDMNSDKDDMYMYGKILSTLYNLDGYGISTVSGYELNEKVEKFIHGVSIGEWKSSNPLYVEDKDTVEREISKGTIIFDKNKNTGYLKGMGLSPNVFTWRKNSIPGSSVDFGSAEYEEYGVQKIVESINSNDHLIHYSKIDGLGSGGINPDSLKNDVIRAINISPAAINKNPPDGYAHATNDYIHGGVIDYIDASSIKSGTLHLDTIKANVVDAINAYIGTATIDKAFIGELDAEHITAKVVDAINLYAENAGINRAVINSAVIGSLDAEHIKASVIDAVNANLENAFIDGAIIDRGTIGTTQIADGSITDAKIVELTANKIAAGIIDTGQVNLFGENAHLRIIGNKLQVFDDQKVPVERVVIGDVDNDGTVFGLRVRGADGKTVLYDESGVYSEGITDGAITNPKISSGAVENKHIVANTITGDKIVAEAITAREIAAKEINANHIQANSITAAEIAAGVITATSAIIAEGAIVRANLQDAIIGSAQIDKAVITDAHINDLNADKINAGKIKAQYIEIGPDTDFAKGFSPNELRSEMENRIPYRVEIISSNGTTFKNGVINTTLTARVYKGPDDITELISASRFKWTRIGFDEASDQRWNAKHQGVKSVNITSEDVFNKSSFLCEILK